MSFKCDEDVLFYVVNYRNSMQSLHFTDINTFLESSFLGMMAFYSGRIVDVDYN
jgi:hypothetical protein